MKTEKRKTFTDPRRNADRVLATGFLGSKEAGLMIEQTEAEGQQELVESAAFPKKGSRPSKDNWEALEALGFVKGDEVDDLFVEVQLPKGWKKVPTDHPMWSNIMDERGVIRISIFYKAAFYDRAAHFGILRLTCFPARPLPGEGSWEELEATGITKVRDFDEDWCEVQLPDTWSYVADHAKDAPEEQQQFYTGIRAGYGFEKEKPVVVNFVWSDGVPFFSIDREGVRIVRQQEEQTGD